MQTQYRNGLLVLLIAVIFFAGLYIGGSRSGPSSEMIVEAPLESMVPPSELVAEPDPGMEAVGTGDSVQNTGGRDSYRIKGNQASARTSRPAVTQTIRLETDWEDIFQAEGTLESALAGNEDDAVAVGELVTQCRAGYDSEKQLETAMNRMSERVKAGNQVPAILIPGTGETLQFTNFAGYEEMIWTRFAQCEATRGLFGNELRARLEELARGGSPTARFLYAMWIPRQSSADVDRLVEWVTYQSLAWDFTWQNIREGHPLGLLAYGRSLEQSGSIYFTPRHLNFGPAFIIAAQKCGLENDILNQKVGNMTASWTERKMSSRLKRAETLSDEITGMFCS